MNIPRHERPYTWPSPVMWDNEETSMLLTRHRDKETGEPWHVLRIDTKIAFHFKAMTEVVWFANMILNLVQEVNERVAAGDSTPIVVGD